MNKKFKGQGALEYLLLIGGAVLIAVIVIALLVGMGGQSRDSAAAQADKAGQALDVPQPAQIVSVVARYSDCNDDAFAGTMVGQLTLAWRPLGDGGSNALKVYDSSNKEFTGVTIFAADGVTSIPTDDLNPNEVTGLIISIPNIAQNTTTNKCGDSYYLYIETTKNNQTVRSQGYRFGWTDQ
jgi:hypothetical protein